LFICFQLHTLDDNPLNQIPAGIQETRRLNRLLAVEYMLSDAIIPTFRNSNSQSGLAMFRVQFACLENR
jgi:hypothetical protein